LGGDFAINLFAIVHIPESPSRAGGVNLSDSVTDFDFALHESLIAIGGEGGRRRRRSNFRGEGGRLQLGIRLGDSRSFLGGEGGRRISSGGRRSNFRGEEDDFDFAISDRWNFLEKEEEGPNRVRCVAKSLPRGRL